MNTKSYYNKLYKTLTSQLNSLKDKYSISEDEVNNFITNLNLHPPIRKKTILMEYEKCAARKQDGNRCTRRHQIGKRFCGKHLTNRPFGIYNSQTGKTNTKINNTNTGNNPTDDIDNKNNNEVNNEINNKTNTKKNRSTKTPKKRGRKPKIKEDEGMILLKSVQINNKYYYMDNDHILYNPEPVNGLYEVIGRLTGNQEIFYATSLEINVC